MHKKTILFIEDENNLQQLIADKLQQEQIHTIKALNGSIGIKLAKTQAKDIDLILLDLILPKKDGFAVLKELKNNKLTKNIPVIILTNLEATSKIEKALDLGATEYLVKTNYSLEEITAKIKDSIR